MRKYYFRIANLKRSYCAKIIFSQSNFHGCQVVASRRRAKQELQNFRGSASQITSIILNRHFILNGNQQCLFVFNLNCMKKEKEQQKQKGATKE